MDTAHHIPTQLAPAGADFGTAGNGVRVQAAGMALIPSLAERYAP